MTRYLNSFHIPQNRFSEKEIETKAVPVEYNGFLIYERVPNAIYDIVTGGICIGSRKTLKRAQDAINFKKGLNMDFLHRMAHKKQHA